MGVMGKPKYGTYDPTWMLAIFYPLFFGMIVGDIGYGLVMLGTVIWLRMKFKDNNGVQLATSILGPAATSVIIFGFIYGEFFGNLLGPKFGNVIQPLWTMNGQYGIGYPVPAGAQLLLPFERTQPEMLITFLIIAIAIGAFQVLLGLALGVYNGIKTKHWSHVYEKGGILAFVARLRRARADDRLRRRAHRQRRHDLGLRDPGDRGAGSCSWASPSRSRAAASSARSSRSAPSPTSRATCESWPSALPARSSPRRSTRSRPRWAIPILGLLIAIPLQMLNFVICAFSPNIHAVRLNFLEFFGKFYEPGSKEYKPFQKTGGEKRA